MKVKLSQTKSGFLDVFTQTSFWKITFIIALEIRRSYELRTVNVVIYLKAVKRKTSSCSHANCITLIRSSLNFHLWGHLSIRKQLPFHWLVPKFTNDTAVLFLMLSSPSLLCHVSRFEACTNVTAEVYMRSYLTPCINDCGTYGQCKLLRTNNYLYAACECKAGNNS